MNEKRTNNDVGAYAGEFLQIWKGPVNCRKPDETKHVNVKRINLKTRKEKTTCTHERERVTDRNPIRNRERHEPCAPFFFVPSDVLIHTYIRTHARTHIHTYISKEAKGQRKQMNMLCGF